MLVENRFYTEVVLDLLTSATLAQAKTLPLAEQAAILRQELPAPRSTGILISIPVPGQSKAADLTDCLHAALGEQPVHALAAGNRILTE